MIEQDITDEEEVQVQPSPVESSAEKGQKILEAEAYFEWLHNSQTSKFLGSLANRRERYVRFAYTHENTAKVTLAKINELDDLVHAIKTNTLNEG